jgi:hypothetical protein
MDYGAGCEKEILGDLSSFLLIIEENIRKIST